MNRDKGVRIPCLLGPYAGCHRHGEAARCFETFQVLKRRKFTPARLRLSTSKHSKPGLILEDLRPALPAGALTTFSRTAWFGPIFSGIASCGGPTELRFFNSVGSSTFFGADRSPSTLCNNKTGGRGAHLISRLVNRGQRRIGELRKLQAVKTGNRQVFGTA